MADDFNCPNCGGQLSRKVAHSKMVTCPYCESTVLLEDETVKLAGVGGVMADEPSLFVLGRAVEYQGESYMPIGQARFSYSSGWWDEIWALDGHGNGVWISVDEGDIAIERNHETDLKIDERKLKLGARIEFEGEIFRVTEVDRGKCEALRGEFPEEMAVGDTYTYYHLSGARGSLITLEFEDGEMYVTEGQWIDPYEIRQQAVEANS